MHVYRDSTACGYGIPRGRRCGNARRKRGLLQQKREECEECNNPTSDRFLILVKNYPQQGYCLVVSIYPHISFPLNIPRQSGRPPSPIRATAYAGQMLRYILDSLQAAARDKASLKPDLPARNHILFILSLVLWPQIIFAIARKQSHLKIEFSTRFRDIFLLD